jgi:adenylate kinase family enzyme
MVKERLSQDVCQEKCFLLDGFPRTLRQAVALDEVIEALRIELDGVINILMDTGLADQKDFSFLYNGGEKKTYAAWQKISSLKKELLAYFKPEASLAQDKFLLVKPFFEQALRFISFEAQNFQS